MNAAQIKPGLWIGNLTAALDERFLVSESITCIINCTKHQPFCALPLTKIRIPVHDNMDIHEIYALYTMLDKATQVIFCLLEERETVLVHCHAGRQRSVAVIVAYLMRYAEHDIKAALDELRAHWPVADGQNFILALEQFALDESE
jgi:protein-tyrosine phosphatase